MREIQDMAQEIAESAREYPADVRSEVLSELVDITRREEELTGSDVEALVDALHDLGVC